MDAPDNMGPAPPAERPFQFTLRSIFAVTTVVAIVLGLMAWLGGYGLAIALLVAGVIAALRRAGQAATLLLVGGFSILMVLPAFKHSGPHDRRYFCMGHLKQLGIALHAYHDAYGSFPPAYVADARGKPMHSWRVLLLPFFDEKNLYARYRFDEPWDGPNNRKLLGEMPECYRCASEPAGSNPTNTSYVAVVGPHMAWRGDRPVKLSEFTDGQDATILLVETTGSGIPWMEPRDLAYPSMPTTVNPASGQGISSHHPGGAIVVFADGSVYMLSDDYKKVAAILTIDGGEKVSKDDL